MNISSLLFSSLQYLGNTTSHNNNNKNSENNNRSGGTSSMMMIAWETSFAKDFWSMAIAYVSDSTQNNYSDGIVDAKFLEEYGKEIWELVDDHTAAGDRGGDRNMGHTVYRHYRAWRQTKAERIQQTVGKSSIHTVYSTVQYTTTRRTVQLSTILEYSITYTTVNKVLLFVVVLVVLNIVVCNSTVLIIPSFLHSFLFLFRSRYQG